MPFVFVVVSWCHHNMTSRLKRQVLFPEAGAGVFRFPVPPGNRESERDRQVSSRSKVVAVRTVAAAQEPRRLLAKANHRRRPVGSLLAIIFLRPIRGHRRCAGAVTDGDAGVFSPRSGRTRRPRPRGRQWRAAGRNRPPCTSMLARHSARSGASRTWAAGTGSGRSGRTCPSSSIPEQVPTLTTVSIRSTVDRQHALRFRSVAKEWFHGPAEGERVMSRPAVQEMVITLSLPWFRMVTSTTGPGSSSVNAPLSGSTSTAIPDKWLCLPHRPDWPIRWNHFPATRSPPPAVEHGALIPEQIARIFHPMLDKEREQDEQDRSIQKGADAPVPEKRA